MEIPNAWGTAEREYFTCGHCGVHNEGSLESDYTSREVEPDSPEWVEHRFKTLRCSRCDQPTLESWRSESDWEYTPGVWLKSGVLYPSTTTRTHPAIPQSVATSIAEARRCAGANAWTATAILTRRTLELVAHDLGFRERTLASSLEGMRTSGKIDGRLFEWANELRLAGNGAVHDVDSQIDSTDARDMMDLVEAIVDYVYVFQARYQQFKNRRSRRCGPPGAEGSAVE